MRGFIISILCLFILFSLGGAVSAVDLTGNWVSMNYSCKNTSKGTKCTIKGELNIQNVGDSDAKSSFVRFYVSDDSTYDGEDGFLK
jgi:hypothetical protein